MTKKTVLKQYMGPKLKEQFLLREANNMHLPVTKVTSNTFLNYEIGQDIRRQIKSSMKMYVWLYFLRRA